MEHDRFQPNQRVFLVRSTGPVNHSVHSVLEATIIERIQRWEDQYLVRFLAPNDQYASSYHQDFLFLQRKDAENLRLKLIAKELIHGNV